MVPTRPATRRQPGPARGRVRDGDGACRCSCSTRRCGSRAGRPRGGLVPRCVPRRVAATNRWAAAAPFAPATRSTEVPVAPRGRGHPRARRRRLRAVRQPARTGVERRWPLGGIELVRTGSPYAVAPGRVLTGRRASRTRSSPRSPGPGPSTAGARRLAPRRRRSGSTVAGDEPARRAATRAGHDLPRPASRRRRALGGVPDRGLPAYAARARPPRPRRHLPDVGAPALGRDPPAHDARRPRRPLRRRAARFRTELGLARVLRPRPVAPPGLGAGATSARSTPDGVRRPGRTARRVAGGAHRLPDRGRRDAPAAGHRTGCTTGCG